MQLAQSHICIFTLQFGRIKCCICTKVKRDAEMQKLAHSGVAKIVRNQTHETASLPQSLSWPWSRSANGKNAGYLSAELTMGDGHGL